MVVEIEQKLLEDWEKRQMRGPQKDETNDAYLARMLMGAGRKEALLSIWKAREQVMNEARKKDQQTQETN